MEQQNKKIDCLCSENETDKLNEEMEEKSPKLVDQAKMPKIEADKNMQKTLIRRRGLPAELLNEIFVSMPLKNAFTLLAQMPNGLLERIVRKMFTSIKMKMKRNKWNPNDCSANLAISENGLEVTKPHPHERNCVRALFPVPQLGINVKHIAAYFEVKFLKKASWFGDIGFCDKLFPLAGQRPGNVNNSIGIWSKYGMHIDGNFNLFQNAKGDFNVGDVVGIGLLNSGTNSPLECFATCNGKLLGVFELPAKFSHLQLFPTISLLNDEMTIRTNFGQEEWLFNLSNFLQSKRK